MIQNIPDLSDKIINLLMSTNRKNISNIIDYMNIHEFFTQPASTKYHLSVPGGLAYHSFLMRKSLIYLNEKYEANIANDSITIISLLHDICKAGAYIKNDELYSYNMNHPKGHGRLSIKIIEHCGVNLTDIESKCILYHMGLYKTNELDKKYGEYSYEEYNTESSKYRGIILTHSADNLSSRFLEEL